MTVEARLRQIIAATAQSYACGFVFSKDGTRLLLIEKRRPKWQAGRLNGIGGKIEAGETPVEAMARELREEAGLDVPIDAWEPVADIFGAGFIVHFFATRHPALDEAKTLTDEVVGVYEVASLPQTVIENLRVLVPLALDRSGIAKPVVLPYL